MIQRKLESILLEMLESFRIVAINVQDNQAKQHFKRKYQKIKI